jgi:hypothetical protein
LLGAGNRTRGVEAEGLNELEELELLLDGLDAVCTNITTASDNQRSRTNPCAWLWAKTAADDERRMTSCLLLLGDCS